MKAGELLIRVALIVGLFDLAIVGSPWQWANKRCTNQFSNVAPAPSA